MTLLHLGRSRVGRGLGVRAGRLRSAASERNGRSEARPRDAGSHASTKDAASKTAAALDDGAITAKVKAALFAEPGLKTLQIEVETHDAVVTLAGSVDTPELRDRAVKIAGSLDGVRQVVDKLVVKA